MRRWRDELIVGSWIAQASGRISKLPQNLLVSTELYSTELCCHTPEWNLYQGLIAAVLSVIKFIVSKILEKYLPIDKRVLNIDI
jgi:hypothetical protein